MPKHGWKWRTEKLRAMDRDDLNYLLRDFKTRFSAKAAKWVYKHIAEDDDWEIRVCALERIADEPTPWARAFLWREFEEYRHDDFGDWLIIALCRSDMTRAEDVHRYIAIFEDQTAHPEVRGSAVFGINKALVVSGYSRATEFNSETMAKVRAACKAATSDPVPYARAGACWLARNLGGFEEELAVLAKDKAFVHVGPVAAFVD